MTSWVKHELNTLGIPPLKRFGQHFLIDKKIRQIMIDTAQLEATDTVIEVGPGLGFLTTALTSKQCHVITIEKDRTLASYLKNKFPNDNNLTVLQGDALEVRIPDHCKIVASPPYNISSKLILSILESKFKLAVLLLQDEFVDRLTAPVGSRDYGRLTVTVQSKAHTKRIISAPRSAFYPSPKVDSAIVLIEPRMPDPPIKDPTIFNHLTRSLFTQRRRILRGVLTKYLKTMYPIECTHILSMVTFLERRILDIAPSELINLSNLVYEVRNETARANPNQNSNDGT